MTVKLLCFRNHPAHTGGILNEQSAILQLQKRKELHHEKEKHFSKPKSTITSSPTYLHKIGSLKIADTVNLSEFSFPLGGR